LHEKLLLIIVIVFMIFPGFSQEWKPAGNKLMTLWGEKLDAGNPMPEYPRPQIARDQWKNLNGFWDYALVAKGRYIPSSYDGKILVPFAIESVLSGVQKTDGRNAEKTNPVWILGCSLYTNHRCRD
jgi:hypothetical protein